MKLAYRKIVANILVLMVVLLPLRAIAMPIDMSADHCMGGDMAAEMSAGMSAMHHDGHQMPSTTDDKQSHCQCCEQCIGDCTDCASISAVTFDLLQFSETRAHEIYVVTADLLFTHNTSPPSRPPRVHYI